MLFAVNDDGEPYAAPFAEEGVLVRFDGKQSACPRVCRRRPRESLG